jgi:CRP-like cAMP-binding protein
MSHPGLVLIVEQTDRCHLARRGDRWLFSGREVRPAAGARLCLVALHGLYPDLAKCQQAVESGQPLPPAPLRCQTSDCGATFRVEPLGEPLAESGATRRLERSATLVGAQLHEAGPFMSRIPPPLVLAVMDICGKQTFPRGAEILPDGVRGEKLFIVSGGEVEVVHAARRGRAETALAVLGAGECFGEMSLLTGRPTTASVRARRETTVFTLTREQIESLLRRFPELNRVFSQLLADRLSVLNRTLESELERGIRGQLSTISLVELVQALHAGKRTGTLVVAKGSDEARVGFHDGRVVSAVLDPLHGEEAFFALAAWGVGEFWFEPEGREAPPEARIEAETFGLLMESLRRLDERDGRRADAG